MPPTWSASKEIVDDRYGQAVAEVFEEHPHAPGYVNVEWDNAVDLDDIAAMERCIENWPGCIYTALYMGWNGSRPGVPTNHGLGCTWLPRLLYERFEGLREVRYPQVDGAIATFAAEHGIETRHVPGASVKHLHW